MAIDNPERKSEQPEDTREVTALGRVREIGDTLGVAGVKLGASAVNAMVLAAPVIDRFAALVQKSIQRNLSPTKERDEAPQVLEYQGETLCGNGSSCFFNKNFTSFD